MPSKEYEKRLLILFSLSKQNFRATKKNVLDYLGDNDLIKLTSADLQTRESSNELVWRSSLAYIRHHLVEDGYLFNKEYGIWEANDKGKTYFEKLAKELNLFEKESFQLINSKSYEIIFRMSETEKGRIKSVIEDIDSFRNEEARFEGEQKKRLSNYYERNPILRKLAIEYHGLDCKGCGFNFSDTYGKRGDNFIEVHHIIPISKLDASKEIDYKEDMTVLCSNCHRIVHRKKEDLLSVDELKYMLKNAL